jgi:ABC-type multidrug transport system ATPase subunit
MHPTTTVLKAHGLVFSHAPFPAPLLFDRLSFALAPGVTWLGGDESSGKTSLLWLLAGTVPAAQMRGDVHIQGVGLQDDQPAYRQQVAWLDPQGTAFDQQTARQVFAAPPPHHPPCHPGALQAHVAGLSLEPHLDKALFMLSSGTRRKVLLAAALAALAPVTLLDQPFMALDRPSIDYLLRFLDEASRHASRTWLVADYEAPPGISLSGTLVLQG